jgi:hypothetical protein
METSADHVFVLGRHWICSGAKSAVLFAPLSIGENPADNRSRDHPTANALTARFPSECGRAHGKFRWLVRGNNRSLHQQRNVLADQEDFFRI